jgi:NADH:ubiquinone oxidoreductase subunit E
MINPHHRIQICMGSSCFSRGNGLNAELHQRLAANGGLGETIPEAEVTGTLCEGHCKDGPIIVNRRNRPYARDAYYASRYPRLTRSNPG